MKNIIDNQLKHLILGTIVSNVRAHEGTLVVAIQRTIKKGKIKKPIQVVSRQTIEYTSRQPISLNTKVFIQPCSPRSATKRYIFIKEAN